MRSYLCGWRKVSYCVWTYPDGSEIIHERETRTWALYIRIYGGGMHWIGDYQSHRSAREAHALYRSRMRETGKQIDIYG